MSSAPLAAPSPVEANVFTTDAPTDLDKYDAFGHRAYADAITDILCQAESPFTLGVFGDWGFGKTSIIKEVARQLEQRAVAFASFDVWRYEGDALRREFLRDIARQLDRRKMLKRSYKPDRRLRDLEVDVTETRQTFRFSVAGAVVALLQGLIVGGLFFLFLRSSLPHRILGARPPHGSPADLAAVVVGGIGVALAVLNQIVRLDPNVVTLKRIEEPERFLEKFRELLRAVKAPRLVIAVDNLDRCSPQMVDELLATIKTYLEPDAPGFDDEQVLPPVVFMIAADDAAIRRHMLARELDLDPAEPQPSVGDGAVAFVAQRDAEVYVDEYLRKFFTATIRLRDMLTEDIQSYARKQLERFVGARGPEDDTERQAFENRLASLVASALRTNPRRIKQFVNSLETKLRVIEARERTEQIIPAISDDVLGIAKVTIIEEEWPQRYRELEDDWRKLHLWQEQLGTSVFYDHDFGAFLRTTRDIEPRDLPAIINLKQSAREQKVPEWNRFREAITLGQFAEAQQIVESVGEEGARAQYTDPLPTMLIEEAAAKRNAEALNVLEAALTIDALKPTVDAQAAMLKYSLDHADLRRGLASLNAHDLFAHWSELTKGERDALSEQFINLSGSPAAARAAAEELAPLFGQLPDSQRREIETQLASEPWASSNPEIYLPFIRVRPKLVYDSTVRSMFQTWVNNGGKPDWDGLEVVMRAMGAGVDGGLVTDLYNEIIRQLQTAAADEHAVRRALQLLARALTFVPQIDVGVAQSVLSALHVTLTQFLPLGNNRVPRRVFAVAASIAETGGGQEAVASFAPIATSLALERSSIIRDCGARGRVPDPFRSALVDALPAYVAPQRGVPAMLEVASALVGLDPEGGADRLSNQLVQLINQNNTDGVAATTVELAPELGNRVESITAALQAQIPRVNAHMRTNLLRDVSIVWSLTSEDRQAQFADYLARMFLSHEPTEANVALNYIRESFDESQFAREALRRAAEILPSAVWNPNGQWMTLIVEKWSWLDEEARRVVIQAVSGWMPGQPQVANAILSNFIGAECTAAERTELVNSALATEQLLPLSDARADLLATAWRLRGGGDRKAAKLLAGRISELRSSGVPMEQQTFARLENLIDLSE